MSNLKQPGGLHSYTTKWNELAAQAIGLGVPKVKYHIAENTFESYATAQKRVAWLEAQIAAKKAEAAPTAAQPAPAVEPEEVMSFPAVETPAVEDKKARKARLAREARAAKKVVFPTDHGDEAAAKATSPKLNMPKLNKRRAREVALAD